MQYFRVKNWENMQHYKDRAPPWIKLYNHLLDDYEFACLQDASKLHLMLIWLLASRNENKLPYNERWIKQRIGVDENVNLNAITEAGFIELIPSKDGEQRLVEQDASTTLADRKQIATTEERRGEERESRVEQKKDTSPPAPDSAYSIFEYWRDVMGKGLRTKPTKGRIGKIQARLKEGYSAEEIRQAIDGCAKSPHHMGQNDTGTVYDDLTLICRSGEKLEYFINNIAKVTPSENGKPGAGRNERPLERLEREIRERDSQSAIDGQAVVLDDVDIRPQVEPSGQCSGSLVSGSSGSGWPDDGERLAQDD